MHGPYHSSTELVWIIQIRKMFSIQILTVFPFWLSKLISTLIWTPGTLLSGFSQVHSTLNEKCLNKRHFTEIQWCDVGHPSPQSIQKYLQGYLFWTSSKEFRYLLVGETSQGRRFWWAGNWLWFHLIHKKHKQVKQRKIHRGNGLGVGSCKHGGF